MSIVVVATITPKEGALQKLTEAFGEALPVVQGEPGCEQYGLYTDGAVLVTIERWLDDGALATHMTAPALTEPRSTGPRWIEAQVTD